MNKLIKNNKEICITVTFLTFTVLFYAPFEGYLQNSGEFWFNLRMIWWIPTLISLSTCIILCTFGILVTNQRFKDLYAVMSFAGGLCAYIQGNFLNTGLGLMDGRKIDWPSYSLKFRINLGIWVAALLIFFIIGVWKGNILKRVCFYLAALLIATQLVSFVYLLIPAIRNGELSVEKRSFASSDHLWEIGDQDNLVVLVLDSFDQNYLLKLVEEDNDELKKLDGFQYFNNYSGLFRSTTYGITPLLTGDTYINQRDWEDHLKTNGTFYDDLIKQNYSIDVYTEAWGHVPGYIRGNIRNVVTAKVTMNGVRLKAAELLYRLAWSKYLPDYIKCYVWLYGSELEGFERYESKSEVYDWYNSSFRDGLYQNGITVSSGKQFKFIHLYGAHEPYFTGRELEDVEENWDVDSIPQGAIKLATLYIDELKRKGVYDNTTLIITSDHGSTHTPGILSNAVLLIKEKNSHGALKENKAPVSEADFGATIVDILGGSTVYKNEESALKIDENAVRDRKYYGYLFNDDDTISTTDGQYYLVEYSVDNNNSSTPYLKLTGVGYLPNGEIYDHNKYCRTCINGTNPVIDNNWMYWEHFINGTPH